MAIATITLATTTLSSTNEAGDPLVTLASLTGITAGTRLYIDSELMAVDRLTGIGTQVIVRHGVGSTSTTRHGAGSVVTFGRGDQFYSRNPMGLPVNGVPVLPYINVQNATIWTVQGDDEGAGADGRTWQPITQSQYIGALGVRVNVTTTPV